MLLLSKSCLLPPLKATANGKTVAKNTRKEISGATENNRFLHLLLVLFSHYEQQQLQQKDINLKIIAPAMNKCLF